MKYKEIFRLKEMLEKEGIPFIYCDSRYKNIVHHQIVYPSYDNVLCSCIEGYGSYGNREDKLEIDGLLTEREKEYSGVVGWLTAEEVFKRIKEDYEKRRVKYGL